MGVGAVPACTSPASWPARSTAAPAERSRSVLTGVPPATLRGTRAAEFLDEVGGGDERLVMARWTGNYRRGNERTAKQHPRNAGRR